MITLDIYPNFTKISGEFDKEIIDECTRFRKSGYHHSTAFKNRVWDGFTRLFLTKKNLFPTGLIHRVQRLYKQAYPGVKFNIIDHRVFYDDFVPIEDIKLEGVTLRPHQIEAGNAMLKKKHGVLWAATNSGKTEVAISVIKSLNLSPFSVKPTEISCSV